MHNSAKEQCMHRLKNSIAQFVCRISFDKGCSQLNHERKLRFQKKPESAKLRSNTPAGELNNQRRINTNHRHELLSPTFFSITHTPTTTFLNPLSSCTSGLGFAPFSPSSSPSGILILAPPVLRANVERNCKLTTPRKEQKMSNQESAACLKNKRWWRSRSNDSHTTARGGSRARGLKYRCPAVAPSLLTCKCN